MTIFNNYFSPCLGFDSLASVHTADQGGFTCAGQLSSARPLPRAYYLMPPPPSHSSTSRPITVRSVKRRDRGKSLERRSGGGQSAIRPAVSETTERREEERAVMV
jgi:hypothetical protein